MLSKWWVTTTRKMILNAMKRNAGMFTRRATILASRLSGTKEIQGAKAMNPANLDQQPEIFQCQNCDSTEYRDNEIHAGQSTEIVPIADGLSDSRCGLASLERIGQAIRRGCFQESDDRIAPK